MIQMVILLVLAFALLLLLVTEGVLGITLLIKGISHSPPAKVSHWLKKNSIFLGVCLLIICVFILASQKLASTPKITDPQGNILPGSIAELKQVELNGRKEWITIRGKNVSNPILLFLAGGPGGSQLAAVRHELSALEEHFVVVGWDQPGSGKSYSAAKREALTPDTYIKDGIALTRYLCDQFQQEKIYLVGESWGSALGIFLAAEAPDLYYAFLGTGQMVDFVETEKTDYNLAMEIALSQGDTDKAAKLRANGPPPYYGSDVTWKSADYLNYLSSYMMLNPEIHNNGYNTFRDMGSSEYGILDKINYLRGIVTTFNHVYPQLYNINLRTDYPKLEIPVFFFLGRHDVNAPTALAEEYAALLDAPVKEIVWFEHSGHNPYLNETGRFVQELLERFQYHQ